MMFSYGVAPHHVGSQQTMTGRIHGIKHNEYIMSTMELTVESMALNIMNPRRLFYVYFLYSHMSGFLVLTFMRWWDGEEVVRANSTVSIIN
jgi:hypothetical protein